MATKQIKDLDAKATPAGTDKIAIQEAGGDTKHTTVAGIVGDRPEISSGVVAPTSTPSKVGDLYVDTAATTVYVATGTGSSSDWTALN